MVELSYIDLQVQIGCIGWGTEAALKVTHAYIIDHNTLQQGSLETQLGTSCGYKLKLQSLNLPANLCTCLGERNLWSYSDH